MKKYVVVIAIIVFVLVFSSCSSGVSQEAFNDLQKQNSDLQKELNELKAGLIDAPAAPETQSAIVSSEPATSESESPVVTKIISDSGTIKECLVKILNCEIIKDYKNKPAVRIYFDFTNNSSETKSFAGTVLVTAFQNFIEIDNGVAKKFITEDINAGKEIKPGGHIKCSDVYLLGDNSPIDIELGYGDEMAKKTFTLK